MTRFAAALLVVFAAAHVPAAAQTAVCRPNQLGSVACPGPQRPVPRPIYRKPVQALDRLRAKPEVKDPYPAFIPSRETRRLGGATVTDQPLGPSLCRPDTLGNLRCR